MAEEIDIPKIKELESYSYGDKLTMLVQGGYTPKENEFEQTDNARRLEGVQKTLDEILTTLQSVDSTLKSIDGKMTMNNAELQSIKTDTSSIDAKIAAPTA